MNDPLYVLLGDFETGHWCDVCNLPSRIKVATNLLDSAGCSSGGHLWICPDCAKRNEENDD